jgi:hypothetical protein
MYRLLRFLFASPDRYQRSLARRTINLAGFFYTGAARPFTLIKPTGPLSFPVGRLLHFGTECSMGRQARPGKSVTLAIGRSEAVIGAHAVSFALLVLIVVLFAEL